MKILGDKRKKEEVHSYKILFEMYKSKVYRIAYYIVKNEQVTFLLDDFEETWKSFLVQQGKYRRK